MGDDALERASEFAEYLIEAAQQAPAKLIDHKTSNAKWKSLHQKLTDLYIEECGRNSDTKAILYSSNLLQKLVRREKLSCLVLNLYPGNEGYSLLLRSKTGIETETVKLPYEESELLDYIDCGELPPVLVDLLEKAQVNVFYSGCVIVDVRDYRRSTTGTYDSQFVLLKPTSQSLFCDLVNITNDGNKWSQEDQLALESQLLLATQEPLCLDPSVSVLLISNRLQYEKGKFNTPIMKSSVKKYSQAAINRKRKFAQCSAPAELKLYEFLHRRKDKPYSQPAVNLKVAKSCVDSWKERSVYLATPEAIEVEKYAKALDKPKPTSDSSLTLVEEYSLERERLPGRIAFSKIIIYQRASDDMYYGEYIENEQPMNSMPFLLGSKAKADRYIRQLLEDFTDKGRMVAKVTYSVPGQQPQVLFAQSNPLMSSSSSSISLTSAQGIMAQAQAANVSSGAAIAAAVTATSTTTTSTVVKREQLESGVSQTGTFASAVKKTLPIQLSVSVSPSGNLNASLITSHTMTGSSTPVSFSISGPLTGQPGIGLLAQKHRPAGIAATAATLPVNTPSAVSTPTTTPSSASFSLHTVSSYSQPISTTTTVLSPPPSLIPISSLTPKSQLGHGSATFHTSTSHLPGLTPAIGGKVQLPSSSGGAGNILVARRTASAMVSDPTASHLMTAGSAIVKAEPNISGNLSTTGVVTLQSDASGITQISPAPTPPQQQQIAPASINITNIAGLPQNISIQNLSQLQGMNLANIPGLQNMQVSLTSVSMPGGQIAVPVPISMINSSSLTNIPGQNQSIIVSSLPSNLGNTPTATMATSTVMSTSAGQSSAPVTSPQTLVTMVTTMPATSSVTPGTSTTSGASSGIVSSPATMTGIPSNVLQLPLGMAGNLTQLMSTGIKTASQGIRGQTLPLLQIPGQQSIQLLNLPQRSQLQPVQQATSVHTAAHTATIATTGFTQGLQGQSITTLPLGKTGQPTTSIMAQQLMQLATSQQSPQTLQQQQLLALQRQQIQQLQMKPGGGVVGPSSGGGAKLKGKKHPTITLPKNS